MGISLRSKMFVGFAAPIVLLVVVSAFQYRALVASASTTAEVVRANQVLATTHALARIVMSATNAKRGFLLTRDPTFLDAYDAAARDFGPVSSELRQLCSGNPPHVERVDYLVQLFTRWRIDIAEREARAPGPDSQGRAADWEAALAGTALVNEVTTELDAMIAAERAVLERHTRESESTVANGKRLSLLAPAVAATLALLVGLFLSRDMGGAIQDVAGAAKGLAEGDLDRRAKVRRADEIGVLADAFNTMADHLVERTREASLRHALGECLEACLTMEEASAAFLRAGKSLLAGTTGAFYMINASRDLVTKVFDWGGSEPADSFEMEGCWALRRGRTHVVEDMAEGGTCAHVGSAPGMSSICIALTAHGDSSGVLHIGAPRALFAPAQRRLVQSMAEQLGLAIANIRLRDKLRDQSIRDGLTGVFNRRYIEETLARELTRAERGGEPVGVLMFDVDHFKRFNDTFGHDAGDLVLRHVGGLLRSVFRDGDVAARFGGEEFMVLCPGLGLEQLRESAQRLRQAVKELALTLRGAALGQVSISVGLAVYPTHGRSRDVLVKAADLALYRAKQAGRDRVVFADNAYPDGPLLSIPPLLAASAALALLLSAGCGDASGGERPPGEAPPSSAAASSAAKAPSAYDDPRLSGAGRGVITGAVVDPSGGPMRDVVAYLEGGPPAAAKAGSPPSPVFIHQRNKTFVEHVTPIAVGTTVHFENNDPVLHNIYARSRAEQFDLGTFPGPESRSFTFTRPGRIDVRCAIHTAMKAVILVVDTHHFAKTDASGVFEIAGVPPGTHTLVLWDETRGEVEETVQVTESAGAVVKRRWISP